MPTSAWIPDSLWMTDSGLCPTPADQSSTWVLLIVFVLKPRTYANTFIQCPDSKGISVPRPDLEHILRPRGPSCGQRVGSLMKDAQTKRERGELIRRRALETGERAARPRACARDGGRAAPLPARPGARHFSNVISRIQRVASTATAIHGLYRQTDSGVRLIKLQPDKGPERIILRLRDSRKVKDRVIVVSGGAYVLRGSKLCCLFGSNKRNLNQTSKLKTEQASSLKLVHPTRHLQTSKQNRLTGPGPRAESNYSLGDNPNWSGSTYFSCSSTPTDHTTERWPRSTRPSPAAAVASTRGGVRSVARTGRSIGEKKICVPIKLGQGIWGIRRDTSQPIRHGVIYSCELYSPTTRRGGGGRAVYLRAIEEAR
ncbi:hypothetical protein EVAR_27247_1 [Eumeta japonica]|uniref:Uncharacterized protein n=1 Tax=Eumeta variegata TaxID=151549 RepID=A0A4C1VZN0_EUMVA|nr:hypothetical protein EVAR_27247_1 [Eumeta japonica]